jgi:hypothetical protein
MNAGGSGHMACGVPAAARPRQSERVATTVDDIRISSFELWGSINNALRNSGWFWHGVPPHTPLPAVIVSSPTVSFQSMPNQMRRPSRHSSAALLALTALFALLLPAHASLSCLDESGSPVGWFVQLKVRNPMCSTDFNGSVIVCHAKEIPRVYVHHSIQPTSNLCTTLY